MRLRRLMLYPVELWGRSEILPRWGGQIRHPNHPSLGSMVNLIYEPRQMTVKRAVLSAALAVALGLEIITPGGGEHPHLEEDVIAEPETVGAKADALRPVVTPPENPWLMDFTLRVTSPEELEGWWVNTR